MEPKNDWMAGFEAKIADMTRKSAMLTESLAAAGATATSPDGGVRVTVGPTGALRDVRLAPSTTRFAPAELAGIITSTAAQAQRVAAHQVAAAFAPVAAGTEAMSMLESFLPPPPEPVSDAPEDGLAGVDEPEPPDPAPPAPPAPPTPPRPSTKDADEDFDQPW